MTKFAEFQAIILAGPGQRQVEPPLNVFKFHHNWSALYCFLLIVLKRLFQRY
jgi:hypothetical protein